MGSCQSSEDVDADVVQLLKEKALQKDQVTSIELKNKSLTKIPKEILALENLKTLVLDSNSISNVSLLARLPHLQNLSLRINHFTKLPNGTSSLISLTKLDLSLNPFETLDGLQGLSSLQNLRTVVADMCRLNKLGGALCRLTSLRTLSVAENRISTIEDLSQLKHLEVLNINGNQLKNLSTNFFNLTNLISLDMHQNSFSELPSGQPWSRLVSLKDLNMAANKLQTLPDEICEIPVLTRLVLSNNKIHQLPHGISKLTNLSELSLNMNPGLTRLDDEIFPPLVHALKRLDLSYCHLPVLPVTIFELPNLEILDLEWAGGSDRMDGKDASSLPPFIFDMGRDVTRFSRLTFLSLSSLGLHGLFDLSLLSQLTHLKHLDVSNNDFVDSEIEPLCAIVEASPEDTFLHLEIFDLSYNLLQTFPTPFLRYLKCLQKLNLEDNQISNFPEFTNFRMRSTTLESLTLNNNGLFSLEDVMRGAPEGLRKNVVARPSHVPSKIMDGLYLGNMSQAHCRPVLRELGITHVLTVAKGIRQRFKEELTYHQLHVLDEDAEDLISNFPECFEFIDRGRTSSAVLVHCAQGISRSATVVIGYVMQKQNLGVDQALQFVQDKRYVVSPNPGFMAQLREFEKQKATPM